MALSGEEKQESAGSLSIETLEEWRDQNKGQVKRRDFFRVWRKEVSGVTDKGLGIEEVQESHWMASVSSVEWNRVFCRDQGGQRWRNHLGRVLNIWERKWKWRWQLNVMHTCLIDFLLNNYLSSVAKFTFVSVPFILIITNAQFEDFWQYSHLSRIF